MELFSPLVCGSMIYSLVKVSERLPFGKELLISGPLY